MTTAPAPFVVSRRFDAPVELVWAAWTEADRLAQWFGPQGFGCEILHLDVSPGGRCHYALRSPEGAEMYGRWLHLEAERPRRTVVEVNFSDREGGMTRHPFDPNWPLRTLSKMTLAPEDGGTLLTVEWTPLEPTQTEARAFDEGRDGMAQGMAGMFEGLDAYLGRAQESPDGRGGSPRAQA